MGAIFVLLVAIAAVSGQGIYIDESYPYLPGPLPTAVRVFNTSDGAPVPIRVYYPDTAGTQDTFAMNIFIGGFHGLIPGGLYADVLAPLASHGYIVAAPWTAGSDVPEFIAIVEWLVANLDAQIGLTASWDNLSMGCNSAGCDNILDLIVAYPFSEQRIQAVANLEPFSGTVQVMPLPYTVPGYFMGGELSNGTCIFEFGDFRAFYNSWDCPRILMDVTNYGHCDILTPGAWEACQRLMGCPTGPESGLPQYKNFVQGVMAAMFNTYSQGSSQYLTYLTDPANLPLAIDQFEVDVAC